MILSLRIAVANIGFSAILAKKNAKKIWEDKGTTFIYTGLDGWTEMSIKAETRAEVFTGVRRKYFSCAEQQFFLRTPVKNIAYCLMTSGKIFVGRRSNLYMWLLRRTDENPPTKVSQESR